MNTSSYYGQLQVYLDYSNGSSLNVTNSCSWSSTNGGIAYILGSGGLYSGSTPGTVTITANYDGYSAYCYITVLVNPTLSITLDGGAPTTTDQAVSVSLNGTGNGSQSNWQMQYSINGGKWSGWTSYSTSTTLILPNTFGTYNIQYELNDAYNKIAYSNVATIKLLSSSGFSANPIVIIQLDGGAPTTTNNVVNIAITASGYDIPPNATMQIGYAPGSNGTPPTWVESGVQFVDSTTITLPNIPGLYTVSVQIQDSNGNIGQANAEITLQQPSEQTTAGPLTIQVTGFNGADSTLPGSMELYVAVTGGTGPYQYSVNNSSFNQLPSTGYITVSISNGPNQKNVTVKDSNGQIANSSIIIWGIS